MPMPPLASSVASKDSYRKVACRCVDVALHRSTLASGVQGQEGCTTGCSTCRMARERPNSQLSQSCEEIDFNNIDYIGLLDLGITASQPLASTEAP